MGDSIRTEALGWWNKLTLPEKSKLIKKHESIIVASESRTWNTLTGREVELIYTKEQKK